MQWNDYLVHGNVAMPHGSMLRVEEGRDLLVYVSEGALWLTQERDVRDRYLGPREWFRLDRSGAAVAQAIGRTVVSLSAPERELYARRIVLDRPDGVTFMALYSAESGCASLGARLRRMWSGLYTPHARPTSAGL